jgi:hypothetical protein
VGAHGPRFYADKRENGPACLHIAWRKAIPRIAQGLPPPLTRPDRLPSPIEQLADIPEEEIWLLKQKSARTRRAYRLDVQHFMRTLAITAPEELRQADHKAVIA